MRILIDGKPAVLKSGSSFDYVAENRLFMGRDTYTLTMTFPLRDCPQNREIFGFLDRADSDKKTIFFECEIIDKSMYSKGSVLVTSITEAEVKCQYVEGRCEATSNDPFGEVYINELDLGTMPSSGSFTPEEAWRGLDEGQDAVALPWINESYPTNFNNWVVYDGGYKWASWEDTETNASRLEGSTETLEYSHLSWQPYLIVIAKRILDQVGYKYDFSIWEASQYRFLLICNSLPYWQREYNVLMPHWTVTEFFEKLELLMMCEFEFDHKAQSVSFCFSKDVIASIEPQSIDEVVDEYTVDISTDGQSCDYIGAKRLEYKDTGHKMQNYYACDWFIQGRAVYEYADVRDMIEKTKRKVSANGHYVFYGEYVGTNGIGQTRGYNDSSLYYTVAEKTYFVLRSIGTKVLYTRDFGEGDRSVYEQVTVLQPVNLFGYGSVKSVDDSTEEIDFVPVCIADSYVSEEDDQGYIMYLAPNSASADDSGASRDDLEEQTVCQYYSAKRIESGEADKASEYYDVIFVGYWRDFATSIAWVKHTVPYPFIDGVNVTQDWDSAVYYDFPTMRLCNTEHNIQGQIPSIDKTKKFKFSFVSDTVPNARAIFFIRGKKYLCEKITATFSEDGMSQLLKGEFYPIV